MNNIIEDDKPYRVGGLLYTPALNEKIADKIIEKKIKNLTSLVFCLEDSIMDNGLEKAEQQMKKSLDRLIESGAELPMLFVRIRNPEHMEKIHNMLGETERILTGYVLPKFDLSNADEYIALIRKFNENTDKKLYIMPIFESRVVAEQRNRAEALYAIKHRLDTAKEYVLNVRVGGNDFSNIFGLRRNKHQNIYDIGVIRDILVTILNVFSRDYIVSGPVWEYFGKDENDEWAKGLRKEIELDMINGFIGKTAIHPSQLPIIYDSLKVYRSDYDDACAIVNWTDNGLAVSKGSGDRMNERKCHIKWAEKIVTLANIYGIKD
ncbi:MAG: HpcH/HpaI aldolase/citrate lyase family protein [Ruminococcus sp.]|nr:HpcH/HpaI aldolase/citrate lyase family protein [Ruminococcus sp.]